MARLIKRAGRDAASQRHGTMHGSNAEKRLQVLNGKSNRVAEKPGNRLTMPNDNVRSRGSSRPGR